MRRPVSGLPLSAIVAGARTSAGSATFAAMMFVLFSFFLACSDDTAPTDSGPARDSGRDSGAADAGPRCDPACSGSSDCCDVAGAPMCIDTRNDPLNCGSCGRDCVATNRGMTCAFGGCVCGIDLTGCGGDRNDFCCPPRRPGEMAYCESLETSPEDCGECGRECDALASDRCVAGDCVCGALNHRCDGTPESRCCVEMIEEETGCRDLSTDPDHCGDCETRCLALERCANGICTIGDTDCETCPSGQVCCRGECCSRTLCTLTGCT